MPSLISLHHKTVYRYDRPVFLSPHFFRLRPAAHAPAAIEDYSLRIEPATHILHWQQDIFGNFVARADFSGSVVGMSVAVDLKATLASYDPFNVLIDDYAQKFPFNYSADNAKDLSPYLEIVDHGLRLSEFVEAAASHGQDTLSFIVDLNNKIYSKIGYLSRIEEGTRTSEQTLEYKTGSCRDSAWLLVQVLRHLGLASRFVSGYLVQFSDGATEGSADLHAWAEVYIPGAGWVGLDTTSGLLTTEGHIPLACTSRPADAAPVTGMVGANFATIEYESRVFRL
ncbi:MULTISPECIES: transglutaminase family protein [Dyadobacter]|nr:MULTISPECIES: transglutaminase family protein [unclassified Dyadobacter]MCE7059799.1 transglutaminase family protein [Dyadobacter sp. CY343]